MQEILINYIQAHGVLAIFASLLIGILTALAPCSILTLPLLLGSASSLSEDLKEEEKKAFIFKFSTLFVLGLVISFSILMLIVAKVGMMLSVAPFWAYALAAVATFSVVAYSLGWIGSVDKNKIANRFLKFKLYGAVLIGMIFGLVSTPCASAPLVTIITVAQNSGWLYSYILVLTFAIGHASLLLMAGISLGFAQTLVSNKLLNTISRFINNAFILILIIIGFYFVYKAVITFGY